jgi:gamma-glutamyltranspeptidase/glutathione hydrolase
MPNSFYPRTYLPARLNLEQTFPETAAQQLTAWGHNVSRVGACGIGAIVAERDPHSGVLMGGADPRRPTYAIGW